ncbi:alternative ribosome rescue aminoacyl-tRNA hydrolase ArfB [Dietzia alimentaria]|uniref:alternative ribosome rescue aminoacyl-tRNA hydrolase ArfB n=1 Tax=Dietzia alimentaria TaxID=665550 RepID=UPI000299FD8E|nr:alternative ribosome rescue aminoacyl-tRNA hydrolase ArfB [Dietzia alimentaria]
MDDLHVPPGPGMPSGLVIPSSELIEQFSRSSGPGGQGVNTADSRVQLSLDLAATSALTEAQRARALGRLATSLAGTVLIIAASEHRAQRQNRRAARDRLAGILRGALAPESVRRPTRPTYGSQRRRIEAKRQRSQTKSNRKRPSAHD